MQEPFLRIIDNLLTMRECNLLIQKCNKLLLDKDSSFDPNLDRKMFYSIHFFDDELRRVVWERIKDRLPKEGHGFLPTLTLSMYNDYGFFPLHRDVQYEHEGMFTKYTINIFLNEEFEGGETDFLKDDKQTLWIRAHPKTGTGALFDEEIWHRGNTVTKGKKYLLRAHVLMPKKDNNEDTSRSIDFKTLS